MKKIEYKGVAKKLRSGDPLEYALWLDSEGELYFQFIDNTRSGTYSDLLFSLKEYAPKRLSSGSIVEMVGFNRRTKERETVRDNDNGAFAKAVCRHLLGEDS